MKKYGLWVVIIFCSGYYLTTVAHLSYLLIILPVVSIGLLAVEKLFKRQNIILYRGELWVLVFMIIPVFISGIANRCFGVSEIKYIIILFFSYCVCRMIEYPDFCRQYVYLMMGICVIALLGYLVSFTPFLRLIPTIENYNGITYYSAYVFSGMTYRANTFYERLQGVFWEPGLFSTYILFALLFIKKEYFKTKHKYYAGCILLIITAVLTKSGAGILLLFILFIIRLFENRNPSKLVALIICIVVISIPVIFFMNDMISLYLEKYLFDKLLVTDHASMVNRSNSILVDLSILLDNPLGVGASNYGHVVSNYGSLVSSGTSTITTFLAEFGFLGIFFVLFWVTAILNFSRNVSSNKNIVTFCATLCFVMFILLKESHETLVFMNCLIIYNTKFLKIHEVNMNAIVYKVKKNIQ